MAQGLHTMKTLFFAIMVFLCLSSIATAELSVEDLGKIREIVNETEMRLVKQISDTYTQLDKRITNLTQLEKRITETHTQLDKRITDQNKRFDFQGTLIITLIGAVIAFVGIPLILIAYQQNRRTQQDDIQKIHTAEIQALREKIESLEEKRIIGA